MSLERTSLSQIRAMFHACGARRLVAKQLSPNDNSKNQIYLGGDFGVLNLIPAGDPIAGTSGAARTPIFKARLNFAWLDAEGVAYPAPSAQLILYPQYPEVRMSGFLRGAKWSPAELLTVRDPGRVLLLGIADSGAILGTAVSGTSALARELAASTGTREVGVFLDLGATSLDLAGDSRLRLLKALCDISSKGWIESWRLGTDGERLPCSGSNCVGVTLESELGITANGRSEPDYLGWEVKALTVKRLDSPRPAAVTLMTPEPTGGEYATSGVAAFVRTYGYPDKRGRQNRLNFGGIHRVGQRHATTKLMLAIDGYDVETDTILQSDGQIALLTGSGKIAASWDFPSLLKHWNRKHAQAVYVPANALVDGQRCYRYGSRVLLASGTDFLTLLANMASGHVYYDPGIKLEKIDGEVRSKRRSQWRIAGSSLNRLYGRAEWSSTCS